MGKQVSRNEYPRPTLVRPRWTNLNGLWQFDFDHGLCGIDEGWQNGHDYSRTITVPFAPESTLSGIGDRDFHAGAWYEREITVPRLNGRGGAKAAKATAGRRMLLHFGASDYETTVFLNGQSVGTHLGGYTPFTFDITAVTKPGKNRLTVHARDDIRSRLQPAGKQSLQLESHGCYYTRTTGIWQTVWTEIVPHCYVERTLAVPQADLRTVRVALDVAGGASGSLSIALKAKAGRRIVAESSDKIFGGTRTTIDLEIPDARLWCPDDPFLYDLEVVLSEDGKPIDKVASYFGVRTVELTDREFLLNGKPVYLKQVLDQGFHPLGVYTAKSDATLKRDITLSMAAGYNGARLHQKVFEPRFLYWADRLGYLCWGEAPDWGLDLTNPMAARNLQAEWVEIIRRDAGHPCIVAWVATNEVHPHSNRRTAKDTHLVSLQRMIKQLDASRPVIDNSGYWHTTTDIIDIHDYSTADVIRKNWKKFGRTGRTADIPVIHRSPMWPGYDAPSAPVHLSEVGGIGFAAKGSQGWGYGNMPKSKKAFMERFADTMRTIMQIPNTCGFCYTQLYDVEQEVNGIYTYDRKAKFDVRAIKRIHDEG